MGEVLTYHNDHLKIDTSVIPNVTIVIGETGSGKSSVGSLLALFGYRVLELSPYAAKNVSDLNERARILLEQGLSIDDVKRELGSPDKVFFPDIDSFDAKVSGKAHDKFDRGDM